MSLEPQRKSSIRKRLIIVSTAVIAAAAAALSYAWYDYRFPAWKEEVLLPDGRMIVVKQRRDFIEGYGTRKTWLTFSLPEMGGEKTWSQWLYPTMIGAADGKVYVVGRPRGGTQFNMYSYPRHVYVAFVWYGGSFERVPFLSVPEKLRIKENVRWCLPGGDDTKLVIHEPRQWCLEQLTPDDKFPMPQTVDLTIRDAEAIDWARSAGLSPSSD